MNDQMNIFEIKPVENIPLGNKIDAFYSTKEEKKTSQRARILNTIPYGFAGVSQRVISEKTGIPRHLIPDRLKLLIKDGKIKIAGSEIDGITGKKVTLYQRV